MLLYYVLAVGENTTAADSMCKLHEHSTIHSESTETITHAHKAAIYRLRQ